MKRFLHLSIVLSLVFFGMSFPISEVHAGTAWYKTSWGMSPQQVKTVLQKPMEVLSDGSLMLRGYNIGDETYNVGFGFDKQNKLFEVVLNCATKGEGCFFQLEKALKAKYGNPKVSEPKQRFKENITKIYEWYTKTSLITLTYSRMWDVQNNLNIFIWVKYRARTVSDKF
jgi:hypothetical protein